MTVDPVRVGLAGRLIALDVDGTLVRSDGSVSARTVAALSAARQAGAVITLATGRDWHAVKGLLLDVEAIAYALCVNGIEVFRADGHELFAAELDVARARDAVEILRDAIPGIAVGAGLRGELIGEPLINETMPAGVADVTVVDDILTVLGPGLRDLVLYHPDLRDDLDTFHQRCRAVLPPDGLDVAFTGLPMVEIVPPGAGKDSGLAWLAEHLGIARSDVVAFGDGLNDLAMLEWAGLGVAMGQAPPVVRNAADTVTLSNTEDGIAHWLELALD